MDPNVISYEHEPERPTAPPDLRTLAAEVRKLRQQIDSLFSSDNNLRELFYSKILPLIREAEERKIG